MTTELQEAPAVGVIETTVEEIEVPDMIAHLYPTFFDLSVCEQAHRESDPHVAMHRRNDNLDRRRWVGDRVCPECGARVCDECLDQVLL